MLCNFCQAETELVSGERVGFRDTCHQCSADLHICLNCQHHEPSAYNECRESSSERVSDRERANRCDYFTPKQNASAQHGAIDKTGRAALDDLFKKK